MTFRRRLLEGQSLLGLWQALASPYTAEICAGAGYDWLLFDGEHSPNTMQTMLAQLQAVAPYPVEPIARVPIGEAAVIKQYLDIGFKSLLVPMVDNAEQARNVVAATRFPPRGVRGVASATSRASGFGSNSGYLASAHENITLIVQIESRDALDNIDAIAKVEGIDALFIGPADLAASLGHLGDPGHPEVQAAIDHAIAQIAIANKTAGIFSTSLDDAKARLAQGVRFVSLGTDIGILSNGARALRSRVSD